MAMAGKPIRPNKTTVSKTAWNIRVTPEEDEDAKALAAYHRRDFSSYVRWLITEDRRRLVEAGRKPPKR